MSTTNTGGDPTVLFSRFAFVFLIYAIITSGYINETLSCQMRHFLKTAHYARHILGVVMVFVFIMLEGGWSFDKKQDEEAENDWSSGNVLHSIALASMIYLVFMISSKSQLIPNIIFFSLVFILYGINTQRSYWYVRKRIGDDVNRRIIQAEIVVFAAALVILAYGFVNYLLYQRKSYGSSFVWSKFFLGTSKCSSFE
jgi:hypothetical protein